jgi:hypothetical protein
MSPDPVVLIQGAGPDSIRIERAPRAGEYGWSVTAYGVDADHAIVKARRMVAEAEALVTVAKGHEAEARSRAPATS